MLQAFKNGHLSQGGGADKPRVVFLSFVKVLGDICQIVTKSYGKERRISRDICLQNRLMREIHITHIHMFLFLIRNFIYFLAITLGNVSLQEMKPKLLFMILIAKEVSH